jgi:carbamate kinase
LVTVSAISDPPPLLVVALGGNALSPPSGDPSYAVERRIVEQTASELKELAEAGNRLLIVHGNGPQVGRLMRDDVTGDNLDVYVSQTQGELGYLLLQGLSRAGTDNCVSLVTRTVVDPADPGLTRPSKAVGRVLEDKPAGASRQVGAGWRLLVGSPRPLDVVELPAIRQLLVDHHVIAGGGGGIAVSPAGAPVQGVVDKDWVAALLAIELEAGGLIFVTDVDGVYAAFGSAQQKLIRTLDARLADTMSSRNAFGAGSMAPKVESALSFARARNTPSYIVSLGSILPAMRGAAGTVVTP